LKFSRLLIYPVILLLLAGGWLGQQIFMETGISEPVQVVIPGGASTVEIGRILAEKMVIRSRFSFRLVATTRGFSGKLQSGHYRFSGAQNMWTVIEYLYRGDVMQFRLTVPEGLRTQEVIQLLATKTDTRPELWEQALLLLLEGKDGEGQLLPETYMYTKPVHPRRLLRKMMYAQEELLQKLSRDAAGRRRLVTVASIIEKETSLLAERPIVASVIYNRLRKNMPLQMDPTVIYGLWRLDGNFSGNLRKKDLQRDMPWNTYRRRGLPPTPICNPGSASIEAAARPAETKFIYFVAGGRGGHLFSASLADHVKNVRHWIAIEKKMRAGEK